MLQASEDSEGIGNWFRKGDSGRFRTTGTDELEGGELRKVDGGTSLPDSEDKLVGISPAWLEGPSLLVLVLVGRSITWNITYIMRMCTSTGRIPWTWSLYNPPWQPSAASC